MGTLIPFGIPDPEKVRTSSDVKSGFKNLSFSNSFGHGKSGMYFSAFLTNCWYFSD